MSSTSTALEVNNTRRRWSQAMRFSGVGGAMLLMGACTTQPATSPRPDMPESVEAGLKLVERLPACDTAQDYAIRRTAPYQTEIAERIQTCVPVYPTVLERNGYIAACRALFDLTDDGTPSGVRTKCNTINVSGFDDPEDEEIADAMFNRALFRAMEQMLWQPRSEERPSDLRTDRLQGFRFTYDDTDGMLTYPEFDMGQPGGEKK